eukprot:3323387-Prymnesium_polylepis.1
MPGGPVSAAGLQALQAQTRHHKPTPTPPSAGHTHDRSETDSLTQENRYHHWSASPIRDPRPRCSLR